MVANNPLTHLSNGLHLHHQVVRDLFRHHGVLLVGWVLLDELADPGGCRLEVSASSLADEDHVLKNAPSTARAQSRGTAQSLSQCLGTKKTKTHRQEVCTYLYGTGYGTVRPTRVGTLIFLGS